MNTNDWIDNIVSVLVEISDKEYQKQVWLGICEDQKEQSSFTEVICRLYDDYCFEDFLELMESEKFSHEVLDTVNNFKLEIDGYLEGLTESVEEKSIINDPGWDKVREKSTQAIIALKKLRSK